MLKGTYVFKYLFGQMIKTAGNILTDVPADLFNQQTYYLMQ
jgi:hypothetical protein